MKHEFTDSDSMTGIAAMVEERHKLLDLTNPRHVEALMYARIRLGPALPEAEKYGGAGFLWQYHSHTRYAVLQLSKR